VSVSLHACHYRAAPAFLSRFHLGACGNGKWPAFGFGLLAMAVDLASSSLPSYRVCQGLQSAHFRTHGGRNRG
jgi:hypothetical protein